MPGLLAVVIAFVAGAGALAGVVLFAPEVLDLDDGNGDVEVVVREGDARIEGNGDALVALSAELIETLVTEALVEADLSFELDDIEAEFVDEGVEVSGEVDIRVQGVPLSPRFAALVHPRAEAGNIVVEVGEVRAAGAQLPGIFEASLEDVINQELAEAVRIEDYEIREVEVGGEEVLIYLTYTGS
ncbi:MAG TPA: hypothetical protein VFO84_02185 [Dehalococcoidia bacterium]|nr:hypothetical protein [Dehalococcoidia bacterium]